MTMTPCEYCIEEECGGCRKGMCDCSSCKHVDECHKVLRPTVRITTKCTQACEHCCWSSSPKKNDMMTVEVARDIQRFLDANDIWYVAIMGGEIFCHPQWEEIITILSKGREYVRIVTNGDWVGTDFLDRLPAPIDRFTIAISRDKWHTNTNVVAAIKECKDKGFRCRVANPEEEDDDNTITPVGRGEFHYGLYSSFACFCHNPEKHYTFLIDEEGKVYKCGFGTWDYATVQEYRDGGFAERFKEFNQIFYKLFISNCAACRRAFSRAI
jgi:hypothetical protein